MGINLEMFDQLQGTGQYLPPPPTTTYPLAQRAENLQRETLAPSDPTVDMEMLEKLA